MHDAELKDKLKSFETVVAGQGKHLGEVRDNAMSGLQAVDSKYGGAVAVLEGVVHSLRDETPVQMADLRSNIVDMGQSVLGLNGRLNAVETELTRFSRGQR